MRLKLLIRTQIKRISDDDLLDIKVDVEREIERRKDNDKRNHVKNG